MQLCRSLGVPAPGPPRCLTPERPPPGTGRTPARPPAAPLPSTPCRPASHMDRRESQATLPTDVCCGCPATPKVGALKPVCGWQLCTQYACAALVPAACQQTSSPSSCQQTSPRTVRTTCRSAASRMRCRVSSARASASASSSAAAVSSAELPEPPLLDAA